jgi:hypothetical protein
MRRIIGFLFFIISAFIIVAVVIGNLDIFSDAFSGFDSAHFLSQSFMLQIGLLADFILGTLYQPIVVLLLSVIAMGKYSK